MNKKCLISAILSGFFVFLLGAYFSSKHLILRELQLKEEVLITNLTFFNYCKKNVCDSDLQDFFLKRNDMVYARYVQLENELHQSLIGHAVLGGWVYIYPLYAGYDRFKTSEEIASLYKELGCGLEENHCRVSR